MLSSVRGTTSVGNVLYPLGLHTQDVGPLLQSGLYEHRSSAFFSLDYLSHSHQVCCALLSTSRNFLNQNFHGLLGVFIWVLLGVQMHQWRLTDETRMRP